MTEPGGNEANVPVEELECRLRELQGMWASVNGHRGEPVVVSGEVSPRLTPTRPHTPPARRSPRLFGQSHQVSPKAGHESGTPPLVTSSAVVLPSVQSSSGSLAGVLSLTARSQREGDSTARETPETRPCGTGLLPELGPHHTVEKTCTGCGQQPPRVGAKFCSHCGRRLSQC